MPIACSEEAAACDSRGVEIFMLTNWLFAKCESRISTNIRAPCSEHSRRPTRRAAAFNLHVAVDERRCGARAAAAARRRNRRRQLRCRRKRFVWHEFANAFVLYVAFSVCNLSATLYVPRARRRFSMRVRVGFCACNRRCSSACNCAHAMLRFVSKRTSGARASGGVQPTRPLADIDECASGLSQCESGLLCQNTIGAFLCVVACPVGYEQQQQRRRSSEGAICIDIDECATSWDECSGDDERCVNTIGGFVCCATGSKAPECTIHRAGEPMSRNDALNLLEPSIDAKSDDSRRRGEKKYFLPFFVTIFAR